MTSADPEAPAARHAYDAAGIAVLKEQIRHERELRELAVKMAEAERLRYEAEVARRLEELNGAHANALADRTELVQKSVYELTQRELAAWKLQVTTDMALMAERLRGDQVSAVNRLARSQWVASFTLGVLMFVLAVANFLLAHR